MQERGYPGAKMQGGQEGGVGEETDNEAWHEPERRGILQKGGVQPTEPSPGRGRLGGPHSQGEQKYVSSHLWLWVDYSILGH